MQINNGDLGLIKLGVLLVWKYPDKVDEIIHCVNLGEVADALGIPGNESVYGTAKKLLNEYLEAHKCKA